MVTGLLGDDGLAAPAGSEDEVCWAVAGYVDSEATLWIAAAEGAGRAGGGCRRGRSGCGCGGGCRFA